MADFPNTVSANGTGVTLDANICDGTIVSAASNDSGVNYVYDYVDITPGATYAFTVDVTRLSGTTAMRLDVKWRKPDGSGLSVDLGPAAPSTVGARQTLTFTGQAPAGAGHAIVCVRYTATPAITEKFRTSNPGITMTAAPGRDALVVGVDKPSASRTGVLAGSTLTVTSTHVPVSNTVYENLDIRADVSLTGKTALTYENCIIRGAAASTAQSLVNASGSHGEGHRFIDCTFIPQSPNWNKDGIRGHGFTLTRCNISEVVDGVSVYNIASPSADVAVTVEACYIHDQAYWPNPPDTNHSDGSHCDGIQWQGSPGLVVRGNLIVGVLDPDYRPGQFGTKHTNSCMMIKPDAGPISGAVIENNWFYGANIGVNINHDAPDRYITNLGTFTGNRFDHDQRGQGSNTNDTWTVLRPTSTTGTFTGNVYEDSGVAIRIRTQ